MRSTRVHITGCSPRSGTTLMMELFQHGFDVEAFGRHEISIFLRPDPEPALYCSKRPQDILFVHPLLRFDKHLWVLFMMRDPRDIVVSEHGSRPGAYWCHLGVWKRRYRIARKLWDHPQFVVVRYEDLVRQPNVVQEQLEARMPFLTRRARFGDWGTDDAVSERSTLALGGVRPVSARSVGSWRGKKGRIVDQLQRYGPVDRELIDLGYETDDAWLHSLEGVPADDTPTVYGDRSAERRFPAGGRELGTSLRFHGRRAVETARYLARLSKRVDPRQV